MSQWFDFSANANKLRQSYLKGFLDISGGGVYVRSDNSLNFYTTADGVNPKFALDATELHVTGNARQVMLLTHITMCLCLSLRSLKIYLITPNIN